MRNKTLVLTSIGIVIIATLLPVGVNYILNTSIGANIAGEAKDWLSFYGSYLGGIFTAYISFLILFKTINRTQLDSKIQLKKQEFDNLKTMLSEQISMLDFARVGVVTLVIGNGSQYENEIQKLDTFHQNLTRKFNSYSLFYYNSTDKLANDYWLTYRKCVSQLFDDITAMTQLIAELPPKIDERVITFMKNEVCKFEEAKKITTFVPTCQIEKEISDYIVQISTVSKREEVLAEISSLVSQLGKHKEDFTNKVFDSAQIWLKSESDRLNELRGSN